jgi:teichuronic acid biosynthesis glycosyltransferase TuaC
MHILSVSIPYPRSGQHLGGLFVQRRLDALARRCDSDVSVVSPQPWFPWLRPALPAARGSSFDDSPPVSRPRMFYLPGVFKGLDSRWLRACVMSELQRIRDRKGPVEVIDAQFEYPEGVGAALAARAVGLPVFITLRGLLTKYLKTPQRRTQCLRALHDATGVISVSHSLKRTAVAHGIDGSKVRVIPNAIDSATFHPGPRDEARAQLGVTGDAPLVVTVGHVQPVKGQHDLIPALARVKARRGAVRLVVIGNDRYDAPYTRQVRRLVDGSGLGDDVRFVGEQVPAQVARWLRAADLFALPSYHEGCCNALLEALACGTPVVATRVGDNAEYVDESRGRLVPVGDIETLAAAIGDALERSWDRPAIAAPLALRTWDHVAAEVVAFYHERLAGAAHEDAGQPWTIFARRALNHQHPRAT